MASWYPSSESTWGVQVGVEWNAAVYDTSVSLAPTIYRWDSSSTDNYGSRWWETLSPDTAGAGSWSGLGWGSGSGTRQIEYFNTRWYSRQKSAYNVTLTIGADGSFGTYTGSGFWTIGSWQHSWTYTIPALPSYTVSYNANGGSGAPSAQTKWYNETLTLSSTVPTRTNYKFLGWSTSQTATSATYAKGASYTANSGATLYAVWALDIFTITYNNGSTKNSTDYNYGNSTYTWPSATLSGWSFYGWSNSSSSVTRAYSSGAALKDIGTKNVYAVFYKEINVYNGSTTPTKKNLYYNPSGSATSVSVSAIGNIPTGWSAAGWSTSKTTSAPGLSTVITDTSLSPNNTISALYSVYKKTVNIYNNSSSPSTLTRYRCCDNNDWSWSSLPSQTAKSGWTPLGWRTDTTATTGNATNTTDSGSFYGTYSRTATFYTGAGSQTNTQYWNSFNVYSLQIPTPTSYSSSGWTVCNKPWSIATTFPEDESTLLPSGNYTGGSNVFYAIYKRKINITYDNNVPSGTNSPSNGTVNSTQTTGYQYYNASSQSAVSSLQLGSLTTQKYSRVGYNFTGWYSSNGVKQSASSTISPSHGTTSVTLYAGWEIIQPIPEITNLTCYRVDKDGNKADEGEFVFLSFTYGQKQSVGTTSATNRKEQPFQISVSPQGTIGCHSKTNISSTNAAFENKNGTSFETILKLNDDSDGGFSTENQYEFTVTATVYNIEGTNTNLQGKSVSSSSDTILTKSFFTMDFLGGGTGVAIGAPSSSSGFIDNMETGIFKGFSIYPEEYNGAKITTGGRNLVTLINSKQDTRLKANGTEHSDPGHILTDFIKIKSNVEYTLSTSKTGAAGQYLTLCWYDNSKAPINAGNSSEEYRPTGAYVISSLFRATYKTPPNAAYFRIGFYQNDTIKDYVKLEEGPSASSWTPAPEDAALLLVDSNNGLIINSNILVTSPGTADRFVQTKNSNGTVSLYTSTNRGVYDDTRGKWIIYDEKSSDGDSKNTIIPQNLKLGGSLMLADGHYADKINGRVASIKFDTVNTNQYGTKRFDLVTSNLASDENDPGDGFLETFFWDNGYRYDSQFFIPNIGSNSPQWRTKDNESSWTAWKTFLHSGNYSSYTVPKTGGTFTGNIIADRSSTSGQAVVQAKSKAGQLSLWSGSTQNESGSGGAGLWWSNSTGGTGAVISINQGGQITAMAEITGSVNINNTTDSALAQNNNVALCIGPKTGSHMEFDNNEIMCKSDATTATALHLNNEGGNVYINGKIVGRLTLLTTSSGTSDMKLWPDSTQTIDYNQNVSSFCYGIILQWSSFNRDTWSANDYDFCYTFIPISHFDSSYSGGSYGLYGYLGNGGTKYVYCTSNNGKIRIKGNDRNSSGNQNTYVLRRAWGF